MTVQPFRYRVNLQRLIQHRVKIVNKQFGDTGPCSRTADDLGAPPVRVIVEASALAANHGNEETVGVD